MSGECPRCSEHTLDCRCNKDLSSRMVDAVIRLGRAQQYLKNLMETDIFNNLSKHDPNWNSTDEQQADFLDDLRMGLGSLNDNLWTLVGILNPEDE